MQLTFPSLASAALLLVATPVAATNLLTNPGFASDLSGWSLGVNFVTAAWQPLDATGQSDSGSASVTIAAPGITNGLQQCVPVTAGTSYDFGARIELPPGQPDATASAVLVWYTGPSCTGGTVGGEPSTPAVATGGSAFVGVSATAVAPSGALSATVVLVVGDPPSLSSAVAYFDDAYFQPSGGCTPEATNLCLNAGRFKVTATFNADGGISGQAQAVGLTDDTGYLWFFASTNVEAVVKVLNGCGLGGNYWVFAGGLTNVNVVMTVTDTLKNVSRTYTNPLDTPYKPLQDTAAFATCP
jgi:hypothetical protein